MLKPPKWIRGYSKLKTHTVVGGISLRFNRRYSRVHRFISDTTITVHFGGSDVAVRWKTAIYRLLEYHRRRCIFEATKIKRVGDSFYIIQFIVFLFECLIMYTQVVVLHYKYYLMEKFKLAKNDDDNFKN